MTCMVMTFSGVKATQIQELTVDGIRYRLNFSEGVVATVLSVDDISPNIPDYVEYEGIKYYVTSIDDMAFSDNNGGVPLLDLTLPKHCYIDYTINGKELKLHLQRLRGITYIPTHCASLTYVEFTPYCDYVYFSDVRDSGEPESKIETLILPITADDINIDWSDLPNIRDIFFGPMTKEIPDFDIERSDIPVCNIVCSAPEPPIVQDMPEGWYKNYWDSDFGQRYGIEGALHVPPGCLEKYRNANFWKDFQYIYEDVDFGGNTITEYAIEDGVIYGLYPDSSGTAKVIGPVDRESSQIMIKDQVMIGYSYYNVTEIANCAFMNCCNLSSVVYPYQLQKVGDFAFYYCNNENSIDIAPATIIGNHAYEGTSVYDYFPDNIRSIGDGAFQRSFNDGTGYPSGFLRLPDGLQEIGDEAFAMNNLEGIVIPSSVQSFGESFVEGNRLKFLEFPNSNIASLGRYSFHQISSDYDVYNLDLPESIIEIDGYAITKNFKTIVLGSNVKIIQPFAFVREVPESVTCMATEPPTAWKESFGWDYDKNISYASSATLHVRKGLKSAYANSAGWSEFGEIIDDIDEFQQQGFKFRINLSNAEVSVIGIAESQKDIAKSKSQISDDASVVVPETVIYEGISYPVKRISKWAIDFYGKKYLTLPASMEAIDNFAITNHSSDYCEWTCNAVTPPAIESRFAFTWPLFDYSYSVLLNVPDDSVEAYKNAPYWGTGDFVISDNESGIVEITATEPSVEGDMEYYTLSGIRLAAPPHDGLYIERHKSGNAVLKRGI